MLITLWTHPRSISTAFERIIIESGDCRVFHEPFSHLYYEIEKKAAAKDYQPVNKLPATYEGVRDLLLYESAKSQPVFLKDMAYHCLSHLKNDRSFLEKMTPVLLIRNPKITIASHFERNTEVTEEEIGYEALFQLYQLFIALNKDILILEAEALQRDTAATYQRFCDFTGLPFKQEALSWKAGNPEAWKNWESWHQEAAQSTGIKPTNEQQYRYTVENHPKLKTFYEKHLPFYQKLQSVSKKLSGSL